MDHHAAIATIAEKIEGIRIAFFTTVAADGSLRTRPMGVHGTFDGSLWFMTSRESNKIAEITANPQVNVALSNGTTYVSLAGNATIVEDRAKIKEFWNSFLKAYFENEDDPRITLIRVDATGAEYWDNQAGTIGMVFDFVRTALTGKRGDSGENEEVSLA